jgi:cytochrome P450
MPNTSEQAPEVVKVATFAGVRAVLEDDGFGVVEAPRCSDVGTLAWFRSSVSRFTNGADHGPRREAAAKVIAALDPSALRTEARLRASAELSCHTTGAEIDVMKRLAPLVPATALASSLDIPSPERVAELILRLSGGYFPGSPSAAELDAEQALGGLLDVVAPNGRNDRLTLPAAVTKISLLVQTCGATAALIGNTLSLVHDFASPVATDDFVQQACRFLTPTKLMRRAVIEPAVVAGTELSVGTSVVCDIDAANREGPATAHLTFGYGIRPCPGSEIALALAAGVVDAVRQQSERAPGKEVRFVDSPALRAPVALEVIRR